MKIKHQGLVLVFIPLVCTVLLCASMLVVESQEEAELAKQAEARKVLSLVNALPYHFMNIGSALISWRSSGKSVYLHKCQDEMNKLLDVITALRSKAQTSEQSARLETLANEADKILEEIRSYRNNVTDSARVLGSFNRHTFAARMQTSMNSMLSNIDHLSTQDYRRDIAIREQYASLFRLLNQLIFLSLFLSFGVALVTGLVFGRNLVRKIKTVEANFRRHENGEQLLPQLEDEGEVSDLDRAFHRMACELASAEEKKRKSRSLLNSLLKQPIERLGEDLLLMLEGVLLEPSQRGQQRLIAAIENLAKLNKLIDEILNIDAGATGLTLNLTDCNSGSLIEAALQCVEVLAQKEKHQLINSATESYSLLADSGKIEQVLINLLSNACKYSQPGEPIEILCQRTDNGLRISVRDKGKGLSPEQCLRVFEKFEQADVGDCKRGIGLGLPICKKIVEKHGGKIGVDSQAGQGCLFWFELPG